MSGQSSPPGSTFEERWPHDAAEVGYMAGSWIPIVLGGLAGLFGVPLVAARLLTTWSFVAVLVLAAIAVLFTFAVLRSRGTFQVGLARAWRVVVWFGVTAVSGLVLLIVAGALCGAATCTDVARFDMARLMPSMVVFALSVAGSAWLAVAVDRAARRLAARGRAASPPMRR